MQATPYWLIKFMKKGTIALPIRLFKDKCRCNILETIRSLATNKIYLYPLELQRLARLILEADDPSGRIIRLTDHPSKYKHKTIFPDELCKCPERELR